MSIVVIGVNHRTAPLSLLERGAVDPADLPKAIGGLVSLPNVRDAVVGSNRCTSTTVAPQ